MNLNIKQRTLTVFTIIILFVLGLSFIGYLTISKVDKYAGFSAEFVRLQSSFKEAKNAEKEFVEFDTKNDSILLGVQQSSNLDFIHNNISESMLALDSLKVTSLSEKFDLTNSIDSVVVSYQKYEETLNNLFELTKEKGYTESGFEGVFRKLAHEIEDIEKQNISQYYEGLDRGYLLMLRRKEKDFLLRKKAKYHSGFNEAINAYKGYLTSISDSLSMDSLDLIIKSGIEQITPKIDEYALAFNNSVGIQNKIGVSASTGVNQELANNYQVLNNKLNRLSNKALLLSEQEHSFWLKLFWVSTLLLVLVILGSSYWYLKQLIDPLKAIKTSLSDLANGDEDSIVNTGKELIDVALNLKDLKERINTAAEFSKQIGSGNLDVEYDEKYSGDVLAQSVIDMREKLKENANEERVRTWRTEGIAKFGSILQEEKDNLQALSKILVSHLCKYLDANQAGIFVINDEDSNNLFLEMTGAFAYDRDKHIEADVKKGEGLIGQCWQEKKRIFMTDIPNGYINITSGLGEAPPNCVLILPLPYNDEIMGVLEMATFGEFKEFEIEFLEELAKNIAATLSGVRVAGRTKHLLEESKIMQESLQAQEEEMRQNMEEMQATQDMMTEKENEYTDKIRGLEKQLRLLKSGEK